MSEQGMQDSGETVRYEAYRGLTLSVRGNEAALMHYAGVVEWELESGASLTSAEAARRFAQGAIDAHLNSGADPAGTLAIGYAAARQPVAKGIVVATESGDHQVFHQAVGLDEEEDPYLTQPGWYHQSLEHDEPPAGPFATHLDASEDAVEHGSDMARKSPGR